MLIAAMFAALSVAGSRHAAADGIMEVTVSVEEPDWLPDLARFDVTVRNVGNEPLTSVSIRGAEPANHDFIDASVGVPTVVSGNADAVFDPGEVWTFGALGENIHGYVEVIATAATASGAPVSATDRLDYGGVILLFPLVGSIRSSANSVAAAGDPMDWTVEFTNVSTSSLALTLLDPQALATSSPSGDLNGDALIDPGEVWRWLVTTPINVDCATLLVDGYMKGAASNNYAVDATSPSVRIGTPTEACPVARTVDQAPPVTSHIRSSAPALSPPTSVTIPIPIPAPDPDSRALPATGRSDDVSSFVGACALIAGTLLVMLSRWRRQPYRE